MSVPSSITRVSPNKLAVSGELTFDSVPQLYTQAISLMAETTNPLWQIELEAVSRSDSSGLAFLVACLRYASQKGEQLSFVGMPTFLRDLIRVSGLDGILPIEQTTRGSS